MIRTSICGGLAGVLLAGSLVMAEAAVMTAEAPVTTPEAAMTTGKAAVAAPAARVGTFHLAAPLARVMPMFTALGERAWAPGWDPKMLSGAVERGSAFTTSGHGQTATWIVTEYLPELGRVSYARLAADSNIGLVDVSCTSPADGGTDVAVRYTLTPLSEAGRAFVASFLSEHHYALMMEQWRAALSTTLDKDGR